MVQSGEQLGADYKKQLAEVLGVTVDNGSLDSVALARVRASI